MILKAMQTRALWLSVSTIVQISSCQSSTATIFTTSASANDPSPTTKAAHTHTITVGKLNNQYSPDVVQAAVNDVIEFQFFPPNHSVARAEYRFPCIPYELTGANKVGFFSGFHPVDAVLESPPIWNLTINDTEPIFYYCSAPGSCQDFSMVGVINPNASVSLSQQKKDARNAAYMVVPGNDLPTGESLPSNTAIVTGGSPTNPATVTVSPIGVSSSSPDAATTSPNASESGHHHLSGGAIAGITIGGVVAASAIGFLLFLLGRHRTELQFLRRDLHAQQNQQQRPPLPEMKLSSNNPGPGFPHDSEDPRFHEQPKYNYDVPPYGLEARGIPSELPSPPLGSHISRSESPTSGLDTRRNTMSPRLMENAGLGLLSPGQGGGHEQRY